MSLTEPAIVATIAALATLASGILARQLFRRRADPTAPWLFGVAVSLFGCVLTFLLLAGGTMLGIVESAATIAGVSAFEHVARFFTVLACGFWILFAIEYTGRGGQLRRFVGAIVSVLWAAAIASVLVWGYAHVAGVDAPPMTQAGIGFGEFFGTGLAAAGVFFVLGTALRRAAVPIGEAGLLAIGTVLFAFASVLVNAFEQPLAVPALFLLSSASFLLAIDRFPLFEAIPGVRLAGRDRLVEEMDAGLVVTNRSDRVDDLNPAAAAMFGVDRDEVLGRPLGETLTDAIEPAEVAAADEPQVFRPAPDRTLAVVGNRIEDADGELFGHAIVCQDVTEARRRERRLRLLNRFLVETVRERMVGVADRADAVGRDADRTETVDADVGPAGSTDPPGTTPAIVGSEIRGTAARLSELVADVRELERTLAGGSAGETAVESVLRAVAEEIEASSSIEVRLRLPENLPPTAVDRDVLAATIRILLGAIADRTPPESTVTLEVSAELEGRLSFHGSGDGGEPSPETIDDRLLEVVAIAIEQAGGSLVVDDEDAPVELVLERPPADGTVRLSSRESARGEAGDSSAPPPDRSDEGGDDA